MNDDDQSCNTCGSRRVIVGKIMGIADERGKHKGTESPPRFELSENETKRRPMGEFLGLGAAVLIRTKGDATLCLDCHTVRSPLTVNSEELKKMVAKWGTEALQDLLANG